MVTEQKMRKKLRDECSGRCETDAGDVFAEELNNLSSLTFF